jgi:hypothetical protein
VIRRSPCELYLKYLLAHTDKYTNDQVKNICRLQQLDFVSDAYMNRLRQEMRIPIPFYPERKEHPRSQRFLYTHRIYRLFYPDDDMRRAQKFLENARAKESIETLVICQAQPAWVMSSLKRMGLDATLRSVELYRTFYWNLELVDATELKAILRLRFTEGNAWPATLASLEPGELSSMIRAGNSDPRVVAAEQPIPSLALMMHTVRMGLMPGNAEVGRIAALGRLMGLSQCVSSMAQSGYKDHERSRDYAMVAKIMNDIIESTGSAQEDLNNQINALLLQTDTAEPPHIQQLTAGHHTTDLQPTEVKDAKPT